MMSQVEMAHLDVESVLDPMLNALVLVAKTATVQAQAAQVPLLARINRNVVLRNPQDKRSFRHSSHPTHA
jgi:hypothetical protein